MSDANDDQAIAIAADFLKLIDDGEPAVVLAVVIPGRPVWRTAVVAAPSSRPSWETIEGLIAAAKAIARPKYEVDPGVN